MGEVRSGGRRRRACVTDRPSYRNSVQEPSVVVCEDGFDLYFVGLELADPTQPIGAPGQGIRQIGVGRAVSVEPLRRE